MLFLFSPISFSPGEVRNVGEGTEMFGNLLCWICYIPMVITEIVFLPFSDFLVIKDRAGIRDCFITAAALGLFIPFGKWSSQPAWNQIVKWFISFPASLFQLSLFFQFSRSLGLSSSSLYVQFSPGQEFTQEVPLQCFVNHTFLLPLIHQYLSVLFLQGFVVSLVLEWQIIWCVWDLVYYFSMAICILMWRILDVKKLLPKS